MNKKDIINRINQRGGIPSLPTVIENVNRAISEDSCSASQLGSIIERDQALASKVLRLANSSYYGLSGKVDTISRAITILGFNTVKNIALSISVLKIFNGSLKHTVDFIGLWSHSLACAVASKVLMSVKHKQQAEKVFLAGIMHDIGKLLINFVFSAEQETIMSRVAGSHNASLLEAELEVMGCTHADMGAIMTEIWKFPHDITEPIKHHHHPQNATKSKEIVSAIHAGNEIVKAMALGKSSSPCAMPVKDSIWEILEISAEELPGIVSAIHSRFEELEGLLIYSH